jgi:HD superfamily phosphodiesterase
MIDPTELNRINLILYNSTYRHYLKLNEANEQDRIFCCHDLPHFLDVARIAYILNLENDYGHPKDIIYAIALLHDIGRWKQYVEKIPHNIASAELARSILIECGFNHEEINDILSAILDHRKGSDEKNTLNYIIFKADKASRACFNCKAINECDWSNKKKNHGIKY